MILTEQSVGFLSSCSLATGTLLRRRVVQNHCSHNFDPTGLLLATDLYLILVVSITWSVERSSGIGRTNVSGPRTAYLQMDIDN